MSAFDEDTIRRLKRTIRAQKARIADHDQLNHVIAELLACRTTLEAYKILGQFAGVLFPRTQGALFLRKEAHAATFESVLIWGEFSRRKRIFSKDQCRALQLMKANLVDSSEHRHSECRGLPCEHVGHARPGSYLCLPLMVDGLALGVLHLQGAPEDLTPWKRQIAEELGNHCALVLGNLRLRELLSDQAVRDPLTRLFNRRYMEESLRRELAVRAQRAVGVIMIDIDHFKKFNTKFTHDGGDELLRAFAGFLEKNVRSGDVACRYGGEEFMLILPGASLEATAHRAEKMRRDIKLLKVTHNSRPLGRITLSLGVAVSSPNSTAEDVLEAAVHCLRQAKEEGRDRVVLAPCHQFQGRRPAFRS